MFAAHKRCWVTEEQRRYYLQGCRSFKGAALKWSSLTKTDQISASSPRRWKERKCDFILSAAVSKDNVRGTAEAEVFKWNYIASGLSPAHLILHLFPCWFNVVSLSCFISPEDTSVRTWITSSLQNNNPNSAVNKKLLGMNLTADYSRVNTM